MSSRPILVLTGLCALAGLAACQTQYSDVYSFKKNSFQPPVVVRKDLAPPPSTDPLQPTPGAPAPGGTDVPGIPGVPGAAPAPAAPTGIPGLDPAPAPAPTPAPTALPGA